MFYFGLHKLILPLIGLSFLFLGCGESILTTTRSTISIVGQTWITADEQFSVAYEQARINARNTSSTWDERDAKLVKWESARTALLAAGQAIKTAALAISIAEEGFKSDWTVQVPKALAAIDEAFKLLETVGIKVPVAAKEAVLSGKNFK